jgi:hypothetical protein
VGLEIKDNSSWDPDPWGNGVDQTWKMDNMQPGITYVTNYVALKETGSIPGHHVEIRFSNAIDEQTDPPGFNPIDADTNPSSEPSDLAEWLEVSSMLFSGNDLKLEITGPGLTPNWDVNGNGWLDLDDLVRSTAVSADHGPLDDLPPPNLTGGEGSLHMTIMFRAEATNDIQGDVLTTIVDFVLNQNASQ